MHFFRKLLYPFSILYGIAVFFRNKFYDWGFFKSSKFDIPIISVGNLEVGGSGKTPMVEYLIRLLKDELRLSTLSRGYGRDTKGFRWVKPDDSATETGDEPLQISKKFPSVQVAVCETRVLGINKLKNNCDLILMDDAYQHRAVKPGLSILLFDYHQIKKPKLLLPAGDYRESFDGRKRADIIIVSKCPREISSAERLQIEKLIHPFEHQKLFFSTIVYQEKLLHFTNEQELLANDIDEQTTVLLITGIAKPAPFLEKINQYTTKITHHGYPDHHQFSQKNMLKLVAEFNAIKSDKKVIIITQKDAVRLKDDKFERLLRGLPIYEWPISVDFLDDKKTTFDTLIKKYAQLH